jgi:hypothetical protein
MYGVTRKCDSPVGSKCKTRFIGTPTTRTVGPFEVAKVLGLIDAILESKSFFSKILRISRDFLWDQCCLWLCKILSKKLFSLNVGILSTFLR